MVPHPINILVIRFMMDLIEQEKIVAERIHFLRALWGYSVEEFSQRTGIGLRELSKCGESCSLSPGEADAIARVFGIPRGIIHFPVDQDHHFRAIATKAAQSGARVADPA